MLDRGVKKQYPAPGPLDDPSLYINRELSWLSFTRRILGEAERDAHPLLERVKFLALCGSNLDEFFMIRVSGLSRQQKGGVLEVPPDGMTPDEQLAWVRVEVLKLLSALSCCWKDDILPELEHEGIRLRSFRDLPGEHQRQLRGHFEIEIAPVLTPLAYNYRLFGPLHYQQGAGMLITCTGCIAVVGYAVAGGALMHTHRTRYSRIGQLNSKIPGIDNVKGMRK